MIWKIQVGHLPGVYFTDQNVRSAQDGYWAVGLKILAEIYYRCLILSIKVVGDSTMAPYENKGTTNKSFWLEVFTRGRYLASLFLLEKAYSFTSSTLGLINLWAIYLRSTYGDLRRSADQRLSKVAGPTTLEGRRAHDSRRTAGPRLSKDGGPTTLEGRRAHDSRRTAGPRLSKVGGPTTLEGRRTHDSRRTAELYFKDQMKMNWGPKTWKRGSHDVPSDDLLPDDDSRRAPPRPTTTFESRRPDPRQLSKVGDPTHDSTFEPALWNESPLIRNFQFVWITRNRAFFGQKFY